MSDKQVVRHEIHWSVPPREIVLSSRNPLALKSRSVSPLRVNEPYQTERLTEKCSDVREVAVQPHQANLNLERLVEELLQILRGADARRVQLLEELQQVAIELAVAAASKLTFEAIAVGDFAIEKLVAEAASYFDHQTKTTIVLHPEDYALLNERLAKADEDWGEKLLAFELDQTMTRGSCEARQPGSGILVSEIGTRLSAIRQHWMEELDDAQVERRKTQGRGQSLRRFPDRRETA